MNKLNKGITLIALVITIIVLVILAGITINIVLGNGGLIEKAKQGAQKYENEAKKEETLLSQIEDMFNEPKEKKYDPAKDALLGTDTSNATWDPNKQATGQAKLDLGETTNLRLKKIAALANGVSEEVVNTWTVYNSEDTYIRSIQWCDYESQVQKVNYGQLAMTADSVLGEDSDGTTNQLIVSDVPIWAWYDSGTIYIWSPDSTIDMHPHSERMFQGMKKLENIDGLTHFKSDNVETMRWMFDGCDIWYYGFSPIDNWNISNVKASIKAGQDDVLGNNGFYKIIGGQTDCVKPDFSERAGIWDFEGSYFVGSKRYYGYRIRDEVTVGGENFWVIENCPSTQNTVKLLAKYPLNKAGTAQVNDLSEDYAVAFSSAYYWENQWNQFYNQNNYAEEDWDSYLNKPKAGYLNVNPIEGYVAGDAIYKAKQYGISKNATEARLLTIEEFSALGNTSLNNYRDSVLVDSNYWLGSAMNYVTGSSHYGSNQFLKISIDWLQGADYTETGTYGVRPILTVPRESVTLVRQYT